MVSDLRPRRLNEALAAMADPGVIALAGGTDLMVGETETERRFLYLHNVREMRGLRETPDHLVIGAATTFTEVLESPLAPPLLKEAVSGVAAPAVRNAGTVGGNVANGSPKADGALVFMVVDAVLLIASARGERLLPVADFYLGGKKVDLASDELVVEIRLPKSRLAPHYYCKVGGRRALAISRLSFAGLFRQERGRIRHLAAAFGAVTDVIFRDRGLESMLVGLEIPEAKKLRPDFLAAYGAALVPTSGRVSKEYRRSVALNLLGDFLTVFGV